MRTPFILFAVAIAACVTEAPRPETPLPPHETFIGNPTAIAAEAVRVLAPASYRGEISLRGLSDGWREEAGGVAEWEGAGDCVLSLRELSIRCRALSVTLVPDSPEPEVLIQAEGNVRWTHGVRGIGSGSDGLSFLMLRNDRSLER